MVTVKQDGRLFGMLGQKREILELAGWCLAGFLLAAAAIRGDFQPICMGFLCALGWGVPGMAIALGGCAGYLCFWGTGAVQGFAWMIGGLLVGGLVSGRGIAQRQKLLIPALAALLTAASGVLFQRRFADLTTVPEFLIRVASAVGSAAVFTALREDPGCAAGWLARSIGVLALSQIRILPGINLGVVAAGYLGACAGAFPAILAGLALDLGQVSELSMTGAMCLGACLGQIPGRKAWMMPGFPAVGWALMGILSGKPDFSGVPGLLLGGLAAIAYPGWGVLPKTLHRRGETAVAQVRLEQMALVLGKMEESLLKCEKAPDTGAILRRCVDCACDTCPERRACRARPEVRKLPPGILEQAGLSGEDLPESCRKNSRLLQELRRGQEQLRRIKGDRNRLACYRTALREQFGYLGLYLQGLSDELSRCTALKPARFEPEIHMDTRSCQAENGDTCLWFSGTGNRYFVLLCDGCGTGEPARKESTEACDYLKELLVLGFPAEFALRSLNSMAVLREKGACTTVDLLELGLDSGRAELYKWGAAPSYLVSRGQVKKIGTAAPPPGLSQQQRETVDRLSLGGGEMLVLRSDGASADCLLEHPEELGRTGIPAEEILARGADARDDATVVTVQLHPVGMYAGSRRQREKAAEAQAMEL